MPTTINVTLAVCYEHESKMYTLNELHNGVTHKVLTRPATIEQTNEILRIIKKG